MDFPVIGKVNDVEPPRKPHQRRHHEEGNGKGQEKDVENEYEEWI